MRPDRKYQLLTLSVVIMFAYLTVTEIFDRFHGTYVLFFNWQEKKDALLKPEAVAEKKLKLLQKRSELRSLFTRGETPYGQSETGVFEYITANAKGSGIRFQSLNPLPMQSGGQIGEIGFKLRFVSEYHNIGRFLNASETGAMLVKLNSLTVASPTQSSSQLQVDLEGQAYVIPGQRR